MKPTRALLTLLVVGFALTLVGPIAVAVPAGPPTYENPVSASFADTFADPSVIRAKDGWWYAYSTADPLRAGDAPGVMHIARTKDFVTWQYRGTVFDDTNRPSWATATAGLWAPDIRYRDGRYLLYFTVTDTTLNPGDDSAIGVATAPSPTGPWTPTEEPVVKPRPGNGGYLWTFDPAAFTDLSGRSYLYYGSYNGGLWGTRLSNDGLSTTGDAAQVAIDNRYEGSYVVRHDDWYYLMASAANCCAGPTTGYSVFTGRSRSPLGPFVDADGQPLLASRVGGTVLLTQNGNRWIGTGHHAIVTDAAGRDFVAYHAIDRHQPWLTTPFGINRRPMLLDRIDWIGGWPRVRAGVGPSDTPQPAPVTGSGFGIDAADPARTGFVGLADGPDDPQAGATARLRGQAATRTPVGGDRLRVRLDLKGTRPMLLRLGAGRHRVLVAVDPGRGQLAVTAVAGRQAKADRVSYPRVGRTWQTLTVELDGSGVLAEVSQSDLRDPMAQARVNVSGLTVADVPLRLIGAGTLVDNVAVRPLAKQTAQQVPVPRPGKLIDNEDFGSPLSKAWSWVRRDPAARVADGALSWPLQAADLVGAGNDAGVLLHDTPGGDWIAETKLHLDLGTDTVRNYQQAGLVAYAGDDDFARLSSVAIWDTRQTEFGRELVATAAGQTSYGGAVIGTPGPTTWLRLAHTRNAAGEHLYRAGTSRDGRTWIWGATWTFGADTSPRVGLVAHGGDTPAVTASFDYLRFSRIG